MAKIDLNKALYRKVYLIRGVEEKIREVYPSDVMKTPVHLSIGQESIAAGVCQALSPKDQAYGTYRSHALYIAKHGDLDGFFAELYGKKSGIAGGKAGSMHLSDPDVGFMASSAVVGTILPVALGAAYAARCKKEDKIVSVFFGDAATEQGAFWETLNTACLKKLPLLFICENNKLSIHSHIKERQSYHIPEAVEPFGLSIYSDRTTDPEKIYDLARKAIITIKETEMPSFLHLRYHRHLEHVGINEDYSAGYRSRADYLDWYERDPIKVQRKKLVEIGVPAIEITDMECEIDKMIHNAVQKAAAAPYPDESYLFEDVFS